MEFIDILGLVAGLCTSISILPQLIKTIQKKTASEVSVLMFIVMLTGNALWVYYGVEKSDVAIIATNLLSLALNIAMLVCKFVYKKNE